MKFLPWKAYGLWLVILLVALAIAWVLTVWLDWMSPSSMLPALLTLFAPPLVVGCLQAVRLRLAANLAANSAEGASLVGGRVRWGSGLLLGHVLMVLCHGLAQLWWQSEDGAGGGRWVQGLGLVDLEMPGLGMGGWMSGWVRLWGRYGRGLGMVLGSGQWQSRILVSSLVGTVLGVVAMEWVGRRSGAEGRGEGERASGTLAPVSLFWVNLLTWNVANVGATTLAAVFYVCGQEGLMNFSWLLAGMGGAVMGLWALWLL